jgi:hypothetical protein
MRFPFFNDIFAPCLDDANDVAQQFRWNPRMIMAKQAFARARDPNLRAVRDWPALRNMDVYGLERIVFV